MKAVPSGDSLLIMGNTKSGPPPEKTITLASIIAPKLVRIVLEGVDKYNNLIGSIRYADGDVAADLALELVKQGLAKVVDWSANMMEESAKRILKTAELQAKKDRLRLWTNYVPPAIEKSRAKHFTASSGPLFPSGTCIRGNIVFDSALHRLSISSI